MQVETSSTRVESACPTPKDDNSLSSFAFKINLRRCFKVLAAATVAEEQFDKHVGVSRGIQWDGSHVLLAVRLPGEWDRVLDDEEEEDGDGDGDVSEEKTSAVTASVGPCGLTLSNPR